MLQLTVQIKHNTKTSTISNQKGGAVHFVDIDGHY
jgi:hypothetical protein